MARISLLFASRGYRWLLAIAALLAVSGCSALNQTSSTLPTQPLPMSAIQHPSATVLQSSEPAPNSTESPPTSGAITPLAPKRLTSVPIATSTPDPVTLMREQTGFRIEAATGQLSSVEWLDDSHMLVFWSITDPLMPNATYLADLATGKLRRIALDSGQPWLVTQPGGQFVVVHWNEHAAVIDLQSGAIHTIFARDPTVPQWAATTDHRWDFGDLPGSFSATWIGTDAFVLTRAPYDPERNLRDWGKIMLVDIAARRVRVLAEQGHLAAVFPDGSLLVRQGWIDGELQLFTPDTTQLPMNVVPKGPWTSSWRVSPDGEKIAWLEWKPPPGDWSDRLPHDCCSGDPHPTIRSIVVWDRSSTRVLRFPVADIQWIHGLLAWRKNGKALLISRVTIDPVSMAVVQMALDGKQITLADHSSYDVLGGTYERADGSLYYSIGQLGANTGRVIRRYPGGRLEIICDGFCNINERGILSTWQDGRIVLQDVTTGAIYRDTTAHNLGQSLDIPWAVQGDLSPTLRITRK